MKRAVKELGYALLGLPLAALGLAYTVLTVLAGGALSVTLIGLPALAAGVLGARGWAGVHRGLARRALGVRLGTPGPVRRRPGLVGWIRTGLTDVTGWRALAYLLLKLPVAVLAAAVAVAFWGYGLMLASYPLWYRLIPASIDGRGRPHPGMGIGNLFLDTWPRAALVSVAGLVLLLLARWAVRAALLHDGAQARLVAVAMKLGMARDKLGAEADADTRALLDTAHHDAKEAIAELRDLARGIHPPVLDDGLDAALATLAARSAVPVRLRVAVPRRPSPAIETIAYFCVAELLTNVAKHSGASRATVEVEEHDGRLRVRVGDDGTGGARPAAGLSGLRERVRTVDGAMDVESPPGGPTVITVDLPVMT